MLPFHSERCFFAWHQSCRQVEFGLGQVLHGLVLSFCLVFFESVCVSISSIYQICRKARFSQSKIDKARKYENKRIQLVDPVATNSNRRRITAHIKIQPVQQLPLQQKLIRKVTKLRLIDMSYEGNSQEFRCQQNHCPKSLQIQKQTTNKTRK